MRSREVRTVRILCVCVLVLCLIGLGTVVFGKTETSGKEVEQPSSKEMVLNLENDTEGSRIPAGYRENMIRLAIIRDGQTVLLLKKGRLKIRKILWNGILRNPMKPGSW